MRRNTLEQSQCVADTIRSSCSELGGVQQWVNGDDLLEQGGHDAYNHSQLVSYNPRRELEREMKTQTYQKNAR